MLVRGPQFLRLANNNRALPILSDERYRPIFAPVPRADHTTRNPLNAAENIVPDCS